MNAGGKSWAAETVIVAALLIGATATVTGGERLAGCTTIAFYADDEIVSMQPLPGPAAHPGIRLEFPNGKVWLICTTTRDAADRLLERALAECEEILA